MTWNERETPTRPGTAASARPPGPSRAAWTVLAAWTAALALLAGTPARAEKLPEGPIAEIRFEGLTSISENRMRLKLLSRVGRPIDYNVVDADLKSLHKTHYFADDLKYFSEYTPDRQGVTLTFQLHEMPVIRHVEFRGRKNLSIKDLEATTNIKVGARADATKAQAAKSQIRNLYEEKGYELAEVELIEGGKPDDRRVIFQIFEGPKVKLNRISFEGNTVFSSAHLRTKISSRTPILSFGGGFHQDDVDQDTRKLIDFYQSIGYMEAKVDAVTRLGADVGDRRVTFVISEGPQYKVRNVEFHGNERLTTAALKAGMAMKPGQPYLDSVREVDQKALRDRYAALGCVDVEIQETRKWGGPAVLDVTYDIKEGDLYQIGEINIVGNQRTRDKVVRRELLMASLVPGQALDGTKIETAKKRLAALNFFQMNPEMGRPIEIKIVSRRPHDQPYAETAGPSIDDVVRTSRLQNAEDDPLPPREPAPRPRPRPRAAVAPAAAAEPPPAPGRDAGIPFGAEGPFEPPVDTLPELPVAPLPPAPLIPARPPEPIPRGPLRRPIGAGEPIGTFPNLPGGNATNVGPDRNEPFQERSGSAIASQVEPGPGTNPRKYADLDVNVTEAPTGSLMVGINASSFQGLSGNFIIHEKNFDITAFPRTWAELTSRQAFRGAGQDLRIELSPGTLYNRAVVSFREPYLFNLPIGLNVSGYAFNRSYPSYNERRVGGRFAIGKQFGTAIYSDMALRVEDINFNGFRTPAPAPFLAAAGHSTLTSIRPSLRFDNRNDPFAPNKGQYLEIAFEQAFGTFTFPKFTIEGKQYFLLGSRPDGTGKQILTLRGTYGVSGRDTPVYERFYAGDFGSMRGFSFRGVGPHELGVNVGGIMRAIGSVEYQFPLIANDQLQQVVFCDFGSVEAGYHFTGFRAAVGTGLRVTIPQLGPLPLAFDLAFPLVKEQGDQTRYFTFFIGAFW